MSTLPFSYCCVASYSSSCVLYFTPSFCLFFFNCSADPRYLHSFPTRRSSDLLARSAARRIDSTRRRLTGADTIELVAATDFDSIVVPGLHGLLSTETALTADEVAVLTMLEARSEEHTSELQSRFDLVCRLLLE